jgi:hypothetical protein
MKRRNSAFPKVTITLLLEVTHVLWLDCFALSQDLWLDFALQMTSKSLSFSLLLSPSVSVSHVLPHMSTIEFIFVLLSHTHTSPYVPSLFSMCSPCVPAVVSFLPCRQIKRSYSSHMFLKFLSYTLPNVPGALPRVPIHSHSFPGLFLQFLRILMLFPIAPQLLLLM